MNSHDHWTHCSKALSWTQRSDRSGEYDANPQVLQVMKYPCVEASARGGLGKVEGDISGRDLFPTLSHFQMMLDLPRQHEWVLE